MRMLYAFFMPVLVHVERAANAKGLHTRRYANPGMEAFLCAWTLSWRGSRCTLPSSCLCSCESTAYDSLLQRIRTIIPGVSVSTDIIAGFCGEREEDHAATVHLMKTSQFDQVCAWLGSTPRSCVQRNTRWRRSVKLVSVRVV